MLYQTVLLLQCHHAAERPRWLRQQVSTTSGSRYQTNADARLKALPEKHVPSLAIIIVESPMNLARRKAIPCHKFCVAFRSLVFSVAAQEALQAHTDALHILDGTPALLVQEIEADVAIAVYVWVHRDLSRGSRACNKRDFWRHDGILLIEVKTKSIRLVQVDRIGVQHSDVHKPVLE